MTFFLFGYIKDHFKIRAECHLTMVLIESCYNKHRPSWCNMSVITDYDGIGFYVNFPPNYQRKLVTGSNCEDALQELST